MNISIGLVSFGHAIDDLRDVLSIVSNLIDGFHLVKVKLVFVEHMNRPVDEIISLTELIDKQPCLSQFIYNPDNPGFASGHNQAICYESDYHLILNPDVYIDKSSVVKAIEFMNENVDCGLMTPYASWFDGQTQHLCKRYPTVFDLFLRGFMPKPFMDLFSKRLSHYEMSDTLNDKDVYWDPPIVSGCFMLFRTEVLKKIGGFDPRFFLYFEDFDISLRTAKVSRIAYVPQVKVVHHGGHAS
ncbi:MAG: hypothetical protein ACRCST_09260, partial [Turicibacter sp.]